MQQTILAEDTTASALLDAGPENRETRVAAAKYDPALSLAVIYQDSTTHAWATQVWEQSCRLVGAEFLRCTWWDLSRLGEQEVLVDAALSAAQADIIVVSIYEGTELPARLEAWCDVWLTHRFGSTGALIALLGVSDTTGYRSTRVRERLAELARLGQLDFLPREHSLTAAPPAIFQGKPLFAGRSH